MHTLHLTSRSKLSVVKEHYLDVNRRIRPNTRGLTDRAFGYLAAAVGDIAIGDFGFAHAERYQAWLVTGPERPLPPEPSGLRARKKPLVRNGTSANTYCKTARPVFRWALRRGIIDADPFGGLPMFKDTANLIRVWEPDEFASMLQACPNRLWQARVLLAKTAGLRRGEVLNLTSGDVDFENGILHVQAKKDTRQTWAWLPKDTDRRQLPLVEPLADLLAAIHLELPEGQPYLCLSPQRYRRLMVLKNSGQMSERLKICPDENFTKPFERICRRAGVQDAGFHDLRRTCITEWLENGLKPHEVMGLAGHSDIETTMKYYVGTRRDLLDKARRASQTVTFSVGATGLEPATS